MNLARLSKIRGKFSNLGSAEGALIVYPGLAHPRVSSRHLRWGLTKSPCKSMHPTSSVGAELARAKCLTVRRTKDVQCQNQALLRDCFVPDYSGLLPAILKFSSGRHCSEVSSRWGKTPCWYLPVSPNRRAGAVWKQ